MMSVQDGESLPGSKNDASAFMGQFEQEALTLLFKRRLKVLEPGNYEGRSVVRTSALFTLSASIVGVNLASSAICSKRIAIQQAYLFLA